MRFAAPPASAAWTAMAVRWLDFLFPPRCLACGAGVDRQGHLCPRCFDGLVFLVGPLCRCCGRPLPDTAVPDPLCAACHRKAPSYARLRAALAYHGVGRELVLRFKHGGRLEGVERFAIWMEQAGRELLDEAELVVPVPLHRLRLLVRGFNQAALLAQRLARRAQRPWHPSLLRRIRPTRSQQGLGEAQRWRNVRPAAFHIPAGMRPRIAGRRVLLVDDVVTTGATLHACTEVLLEAGAAAVDALALARVVREEGSGPI